MASRRRPPSSVRLRTTGPGVAEAQRERAAAQLGGHRPGHADGALADQREHAAVGVHEAEELVAGVAARGRARWCRAYSTVGVSISVVAGRLEGAHQRARSARAAPRPPRAASRRTRRVVRQRPVAVIRDSVRTGLSDALTPARRAARRSPPAVPTVMRTRPRAPAVKQRTSTPLSRSRAVTSAAVPCGGTRADEVGLRRRHRQPRSASAALSRARSATTCSTRRRWWSASVERGQRRRRWRSGRPGRTRRRRARSAIELGGAHRVAHPQAGQRVRLREGAQHQPVRVVGEQRACTTAARSRSTPRR